MDTIILERIPLFAILGVICFIAWHVTEQRCRALVLNWAERNRKDGFVYRGWARCDSYWWGIWGDGLEVVWRGEPPPAYRLDY